MKYKSFLILASLLPLCFCSGCDLRKQTETTWKQVRLSPGHPAPAARGETLAYASLLDAIAAGDVYAAAGLLKNAEPSLAERRPDGSTPLLEAARLGRPQIAGLLIEAGADPNTPDRKGQFLPHVAAISGEVRMLQFLGERGIALEPRNLVEHTPLHAAAIAGQNLAVRTLAGLGASLDLNATRGVYSPALALAAEQKQWSTTRLLWALGSLYNIHHAVGYGDLPMVRRMVEAQPALLENTTAAGYTPLVSAISADQLETAAYLLEAGSVPNLMVRPGIVIPGEDGGAILDADTPMSIAVSMGRKGMIDLLLKHGVDVNERMLARRGETVYHGAAAAGNVEMAQFLLDRGADLNAASTLGDTPLHVAVAHDQAAMTRFLLAHGAATDTQNAAGETAMHLAAKKNDVESISLLLDNGANPTIPNAQRDTALHLAAARGHREATARLLSAKVPVDTSNAAGETSLHLAAAGNFDATALLLIEAGAPVDAADKEGATPIFRAASAEHGEMLEILVGHGATLAISDSRGSNPLFAALQEGRIGMSETLVERGLPISAKNKEGHTPLHLAAVTRNNTLGAWLLARGADVHAKDNQGNTPLHAAAKAGSSDLVLTLCRAGADVDPLNNANQTPLALAAGSGNLPACRTLILQGAALDTRDARLRNLAHHAVESGNVQLLRYLMSLQVDADSPDQEGLHPLHLAADLGDAGMVEALIHHGVRLNPRNASGRTPLDLVRATRRRSAAKKDAEAAEAARTRVAVLLQSSLQSAAWRASRAGDDAALATLLNTNPELCETEILGMGLLHYAAEAGQEASVRLLLKSGAPANAASNTPAAVTPLHLAVGTVNTGVVAALLEAGADSAKASADGVSPMQAAFRAGNVPVVELIASYLQAMQGGAINDGSETPSN